MPWVFPRINLRNSLSSLDFSSIRLHTYLNHSSTVQTRYYSLYSTSSIYVVLQSIRPFHHLNYDFKLLVLHFLELRYLFVKLTLCFWSQSLASLCVFHMSSFQYLLIFAYSLISIFLTLPILPSFHSNLSIASYYLSPIYHFPLSASSPYH